MYKSGKKKKRLFASTLLIIFSIGILTHNTVPPYINTLSTHTYRYTLSNGANGLKCNGNMNNHAHSHTHFKRSERANKFGDMIIVHTYVRSSFLPVD